MTAERFVLLGLARAQAAWLTALARGATSAALPVDLVKSLSAEELRARLRSGRRFSAVLVDAGLSACDRDLVELASAHGCAVVVVVDDAMPAPPWQELGASALLPASFGRDELLRTLRAVARPIARHDRDHRDAEPLDADDPGGWRGRLVAVTGAAGSGRSTLAMALAAGLAADPRDQRLVVLADLALHAQQGVLHDAGDVVPGLLELVDGHRKAVLAADEVRRSCFEVSGHGYDLLLGLRRHRDWIALRVSPFRTTLDNLRRCYRIVVADVDADVEGEAETGSVDVEERNMVARVTLRQADVVLVVGPAGLGGLHAQLRVLRDLDGLGVAPERVVSVINRAPRSPRARAELSRTLAELLDRRPAGAAMAGPLFVPERRWLDELVRNGGRLPAALVQPLTTAVRGLLDQAPAIAEAGDVPEAPPAAVVPGTLASWSGVAEEAAR